MENERYEGTEEQYFKSPSEEFLVRDVHVRHYNHHRKYPQQFDPGCGFTRDFRNDDVDSLVGMIHYGNYEINTDMDKILYLLGDWDVEDCISSPLALHMR